MFPGSNGYDLPLQEEGYRALQRITSFLLISLQDVNQTIWMSDIQDFLSQETRDGQKDLEINLTGALERQLDHLERLRSFGRASQYNRKVQSDSLDNLSPHCCNDSLMIITEALKVKRLLTVRYRYGLEEALDNSTEGSTRNMGP